MKQHHSAVHGEDYIGLHGHVRIYSMQAVNWLTDDQTHSSTEGTLITGKCAHQNTIIETQILSYDPYVANAMLYEVLCNS